MTDNGKTVTARPAPAAGAIAKLSRLSIVGYGAGDAANNLAFTTATSYLLVYYTDVAHIEAAAAGTLMLVVRIFDAFTDMLAGRIVDRTYSRRFGKFRPFLMFGSVPLLLLTVASFSVPQIGHTGALIYAYVTYAALGMAYSLVNIPYGSLAGAMTQDPAERSKLASARSIGAGLVGAALGVFLAPRIVPGANLQQLFTFVTLCFVVVGTALYFFTALTAKERVVRAVPKVSMRQSFATLKGNKPLLLLCLSSFVLLTGYLSLATVQLYYLRDVLGALQLFAWVSLIQIALTFGLSAVLPRLVRRIGKKRIYLIGAVITVIGGVMVLVAPASSVAFGFAGLVVSYLGILSASMVLWAIESDTVEYGEWKTGVRSEGITYALFSFTRKSGQALGGALAAYAIAWGGYNAATTHQTAHADLGIRVGVGLIPAACALIAFVIMFFYPLTDKRHAQILAEVQARRAVTGDGTVIDPELSTASFRTQRNPSQPPLDE
jgi:glucuronide carrier protein